MQILGLLGMCFDAVVVRDKTFFQIGSGHTVYPFVLTVSFILAIQGIALWQLLSFSDRNFASEWLFFTSHLLLRPFSLWTFISLFLWTCVSLNFYLDFYFPFLFGLLFPFSIWTFISPHQLFFNSFLTLYRISISFFGCWGYLVSLIS